MSSTLAQHPLLPRGMHLLERGWLSSNNVLLIGEREAALIDSGYVGHATQTLALLRQALQVRPLTHLVNTHLHSDHCGGNALLQSSYPDLHTAIAPGESGHVMPWQPEKLSHESTGQACAPFSFTTTLAPGTQVRLGDWVWDVIAAPGHDPHAIMLWCDRERILISADALWEQGFGIVFPELVGKPGFDDVGKTLDVIERLHPRVVLPGHGRVFTNVEEAIAQARARLGRFITRPASHHQHAIKALLKFLLLDWQQCSWPQLCAWLENAHFIRDAIALGIERGYAPKLEDVVHDWPNQNGAQGWLAAALDGLIRQDQLRTQDGVIFNV